jgi:cobalt-zinc-cadmium efflux system outer membrane protein
MEWVRRLFLPLGALLLPGCMLLGSGRIEQEILDLSAKVEPPAPYHVSAPLASPAAPISPAAWLQKDELAPAPDGKDLKEEKKKFTLTIPPNLPGADVPPVRQPTTAGERDKTYPPIPPVPPLALPAPGPEGRPLSLADLQRLAETYSPAIKNAIAAVEAAKGAAKQAGMYPNPTFAYEHDTAQTGPAGYAGFYINQVIKTGGKLTVAQAAAVMDLLNAKLALRRARSDLRYQVRGFYFAHLVARENMKVSEALFTFTDEVYRFQVRLVGIAPEFGSAAAYEPLQLRPLVLQARFNLLQARNQYLASWRQLAAALGLPNMPLSEVEGRIDMAVPTFRYEEVLARLNQHTDVLTALVSLQKAKYALEQAKLVPLPDLTAQVLIQKDYTTPPNQLVHSFQITMPIPIWDQNKGGIYQAKWLLGQASVGPDMARNALIGTLADAFQRYETARENVETAIQQVRDQVRAYRNLYRRWQATAVLGVVSFGDIVTAEQALVGYVAGYITALGLQWQAAVDVANLLQSEDLFEAGPPQPMEPLPDLRFLPPLPKHLPQPPQGAETVACPPEPGHYPSKHSAPAAAPAAPKSEPKPEQRPAMLPAQPLAAPPAASLPPPTQLPLGPGTWSPAPRLE